MSEKYIAKILSNRNRVNVADIKVARFESDCIHLVPIKGTNTYTAFLPKELAMIGKKRQRSEKRWNDRSKVAMQRALMQATCKIERAC